MFITQLFPFISPLWRRYLFLQDQWSDSVGHVPDVSSKRPEYEKFLDEVQVSAFRWYWAQYCLNLAKGTLWRHTDSLCLPTISMLGSIWGELCTILISLLWPQFKSGRKSLQVSHWSLSGLLFHSIFLMAEKRPWHLAWRRRRIYGKGLLNREGLQIAKHGHVATGSTVT